MAYIYGPTVYVYVILFVYALRLIRPLVCKYMLLGGEWVQRI